MQLAGDVFGEDLKKILPIIREDGSDSQKFDNCLEFLVLSGRSLAQAMMMMVPEPWERHKTCLITNVISMNTMQPNGAMGRASIYGVSMVSSQFVLDRNGLRPSRYYVTSDDKVILASEVGVVVNIDLRQLLKGRLEPGRMFLIDMEEGRIINDSELKEAIAKEEPYGEWLKKIALI